MHVPGRNVEIETTLGEIISITQQALPGQLIV
jgi:hypothetical protein